MSGRPPNNRFKWSARQRRLRGPVSLRELGKPYFFLEGRANRTRKWPKGAKSPDKMYDWTWDNLKVLIGGAR